MSLTAFHPLSIDDLVELELPAIRYVVSGVLPAGSLTLHAAREKAGKSLQGIDLCVSVASGEPFIDLGVQQGTALYVPAEENLRDVRARILTRLDGRRDVPLFVLPVNGFTDDRLRLDDPDSVAALHQIIVELEPNVVYLDPLRELHGQAENDADAMAPLLRPLRQIAHETDTAIVIAHHMGRLSGQARGSTAIRGSVDQEWAFTRTDDDTEGDATASVGRLRIEGRFGPKQVLDIRLGDNLRWKPTNLVTAEHFASVRERILSYLVETNAWHDAEAITAHLDVALKTVQNTLSAMNREEPLPFAKHGSGKRNDPRKYHALTSDLWSDDDHADSSFLPKPPYIPREEQSNIASESIPDSSGNVRSKNGNKPQTIPPDTHIGGSGTKEQTTVVSEASGCVDDPIPPKSDDPWADVDFGDDDDDIPTCYDCAGPAPADGHHWCLACRKQGGR